MAGLIQTEGGAGAPILLGNYTCYMIILIEQVQRGKKSIEHLIMLTQLHPIFDLSVSQ